MAKYGRYDVRNKKANKHKKLSKFNDDFKKIKHVKREKEKYDDYSSEDTNA